jgi:phenylpropionate dioxygenase-like ring-hydroxylating dioxygenase large terminal subunit
MIEATHWHPVALIDDVAHQPLAVTLLGQPLVLWRDTSGQVQAWADQCPHRGAKLSLGRVHGGVLECPYHGWQFEASGRCVHVPALPAFTPPLSHCARTYSACEAYGLVWVKLDKSAKEVALPAFLAEADLQLRKLNCGPYDVATSAPRIVENFLDMAHFGFVHEGWLGARETTAIADYQVQGTPHGLIATQCKAWQPQSSVSAKGPTLVEYTYEVTAPYCAVLTKLPDAQNIQESFHDSIALFVCPLTPETSRVWFRLAVADVVSSEDTQRAFQDTIFLQDKPILESQSPKSLPLDLRAELHTTADKASSLYRRHLKNLGITFGVC